jgi:hypothetical protein
MAGPAPGRPKVGERWIRYSSKGALTIELNSNFCPAMAVPTTVKMPEPMTAPMPRAVSDQGPSVFFSRCSGSSESEMSLSIDLRESSWLASALLLGRIAVERRSVFITRQKDRSSRSQKWYQRLY